ncbi:hypothetical protein niasHT_003779 [Heterodera trifolii]|uniref:General transcription factor 3C polypeptide 1 n=1 Tax=Heterodera trifolii TaxID=157864 RepID=A0ABD2LUU3_9BILA
MESDEEFTEVVDVDEAEGGASNTGSIFSAYDHSSFSYLHLYRPQTDVVASLIYYSGMEGVDRYEISKHLGINAKTKAGNRTVSNSIHAVMKTYPDNFGIFQKMEGKHRFLKYYAKCEQHTPAGGTALVEFYKRFKELTGAECPYKLGESIKFTQHNLSTLRISDVTLKRLVRILEYVYQEKVVITQYKIEVHISAEERKEGYSYQVDRKSLKKCIIALAKKNFINTMKLEVTERGLSNSVDVITAPKIQTLEHPLIFEALKQIKAEFKGQSKSFPSGVRLKQEPEAKTSEDGGGKSDEGIADTSDLKQEEAEEKEIGASLLNKTFNTLQRISMQKYAKKGAGTPISVLSQRSLNSLVDSAKRRRLTKSTQGVKKRRLNKEREQIKQNGEEQFPSSVANLRHLNKKDRRVYDTVDKLSLQHKAYLRSRFTQRERDMLLLIRACSFFLNPVARFWPNPKVIRTLMHEYVPESRTKTTYSLLAAGVREVRSKERYAHHQYIVKTMASYKELLDLRNHLASLNFSQTNKMEDQLQQKDFFFMNAFRASYQLLFREAADFPSVHVTDSELRRYLNSNNLYFLSTSDRQKAETSLWKNNLEDKNEVPQFIVYNTIMLVILGSVSFRNKKTKNEKGNDEDIGDEMASKNDKVEGAEMNKMDAETANFIIEQLEIQTLADVLEKMRTGGLVTKKRFVDMRQSLGVRASAASETTLSETVQNIDVEMEMPTETKEREREMPEVEIGGECFGTARDAAPVATKATESPQKLGIQMGGEWRNHVRCTQFYQHFFQPEYHKNLCESLFNEYSHALTNRIWNSFGESECPGQLLTLANHLCQNLSEFSITTSMPNSIKELFSARNNEIMNSANDGSDLFGHFTASATKQLRYLETTELRLELVKIQPELSHSFIESQIQLLPDPECLVNVQIVHQNKMPKELDFECTYETQNNAKNSGQSLKVQEKSPICGKKSSSLVDSCCKLLLDLVDESGVVGVSEEELKERMSVHNFDVEMVQQQLSKLVESADVIICGIDEVRFVSICHCRPWLIRTREGHGFVPKPWLFPSGQVNWKVLRWMLEGVLSVVFHRSGLTEQELVSHFAPVLQPVLTLELVQILSKLGCLSQFEKILTEARKSDPFLRFVMSSVDREVQSLINTLGFLNNGVYYPEPDCFQSVRDLIRYLHRDDRHFTVRRLCMGHNIVKSDLVPILNSEISDELFGATLRLCVNLCQPTLLAFGGKLPGENEFDLWQIFYEIETSLVQSLGAFTDVILFKKFFVNIQQYFDKDWEDRSENQRLLVERIFVLLSYVFAIGTESPAKYVSVPEVDYCDREKAIKCLFSSGIETIFLKLSINSTEREFCCYIVSILALVFGSLNPLTVSRGDDDLPGSKPEEKALFEGDEAAKIELAKCEEANKRMANRRSFLTGTFTLKGVKAFNSENDFVLRGTVANKENGQSTVATPLKALSERKRPKRLPKNLQMSSDIDGRLSEKQTDNLQLLAPEAMRSMKDFFWRLLIEGRYNKLMKMTREIAFIGSDRHNSQNKLNEQHFLSLATFALAFARHSHISCQNVSATFSVEFFHMVTSYMTNCFELMKADRHSIRKYAFYARHAIRNFKEMMIMLNSISNSKFVTDKDHFEQFCQQVFEIEEYRELVGNSLAQLSPAGTTNKMLQDLLIANHYFLHVMEKNAKETHKQEAVPDFADFISEFATPFVINWYIFVLKSYRTNPKEVNMAILKLFHRIAIDLKNPARLFQASLFQIFDEIGQEIGKRYHNTEGRSAHPHFKIFEFGYHLLRKFFSLYKLRGGGVSVCELLFLKSTKEAREIENGSMD